MHSENNSQDFQQTLIIHVIGRTETMVRTQQYVNLYVRITMIMERKLALIIQRLRMRLVRNYSTAFAPFFFFFFFLFLDQHLLYCLCDMNSVFRQMNSNLHMNSNFFIVFSFQFSINIIINDKIGNVAKNIKGLFKQRLFC